MKLVRASEFARDLGIPGRTIRQWCKDYPVIAEYRDGGVGGGGWWIKLEAFAEQFGLSLVDVYTLHARKLVKISVLATKSKISKKTIGNWCRNRPGFALQIGHNYYVDLEQLGATDDQIEELVGGDSSQEEPEEDAEPEVRDPVG